MLFLNNLAKPFAIVFSVVATKWDIFENLSLSDAVHTGVEVCRIDSEMSGLVE